MTGELDTTIHMNPVDIELFKQFCQYYEPFKVIIESRVFEINNGTATLSFKDTILMDVNINIRTYKRKLSTGP